MKSRMIHNFAQVPRADIPRSSFDRKHSYKTTFNEGYLVPFYVDEALPADTFKMNASMLARLATPIVPIMDNIYLDVFFFAVPYRLVWDNWQRFNGERVRPDDIYDGLIPQITTPEGGYSVGSLADYFGLPTEVDKMPTVSSLPFRAYNLIYNEWFRDENLQDPAVFNTDDTIEVIDNFPLRRRGKRHDYFTSCLPWPQKGAGATLPLGLSAPVIGNGNIMGLTDGINDVNLAYLASSKFPAQAVGSSGEPLGSTLTPSTTGTNLGLGLSTDASDSGLIADLTQASAATINSLRQAFSLQHFYEADARGGTRYTEILLSHFGVESPDARLQRPEYLGGGTFNVSINSVPQTSSTDSITPQGNLSAFGLVTGNCGFVKSFVEHSIIIGIASVRADLTYQKGIDRMWSRRERTDFYWPAFAHIGEQAVLNKEIFAQASDVLNDNGEPINDDVFGYQERFAEYRYAQSHITGKLRSSYAQSLDIWHLSQDFSELPKLNDFFIEENPPIDRIVAVQDEPHFIFDSFLDLTCVRPMPVFGVPGLRKM